MARGTVVAFDDDAGFGTLRATDGPGPRGVPEELFFHCTAIADGSRHIDIGAEVRFAVVPGRLGRWEASDVSPV